MLRSWRKLRWKSSGSPWWLLRIVPMVVLWKDSISHCLRRQGRPGKPPASSPMQRQAECNLGSRLQRTKAAARWYSRIRIAGKLRAPHPTSPSERSQYWCLCLRGHFLEALPAARSRDVLSLDWFRHWPRSAGASQRSLPDPRAAGDDLSREVSAADDYRLRWGVGRRVAAPTWPRPRAGGGDGANPLSASGLCQPCHPPRPVQEVSVALFQHRTGEPKRSCRTTEVAFPETGGSALTQLFGCFSFQLLKRVLEYQRHELRTVPHGDECSKKALCHPNVEWVLRQHPFSWRWGWFSQSP